MAGESGCRPPIRRPARGPGPTNSVEARVTSAHKRFASRYPNSGLDPRLYPNAPKQPQTGRHGRRIISVQERSQQIASSVELASYRIFRLDLFEAQAAPRFRGATQDQRGNSGRRRCLRVDTLAQRHRVQLGVCRLLLVEVGRQEAYNLVVAEFFGPCDQRPVAAHFVMFDGLGVCDDGGIQYRLVLDLARGLIGFLDDAVDRRTLRPARLLAELFEHLLKAFNL